MDTGTALRYTSENMSHVGELGTSLWDAYVLLNDTVSGLRMTAMGDLELPPALKGRTPLYMYSDWLSYWLLATGTKWLCPEKLKLLG